MLRICCYIFLLLWGIGHPFSKVPVQESLGVRTLRYVDEARARPVTVELWYPTHVASIASRSDDSLWLHPEEVRDAPLCRASSAFPLIVMSHGHRGERRDRSWLAEVLVRNGYIVASVEHFGSAREFYSPLISLRFWERPRDVSFALDQLLQESFLKGKIDAERIGFVGYSLGGMTGLSLAGATARNVKDLLLKQKRRLGIEAAWVEGVDFRVAEANYRERRIGAFLLICPAIFIFPTDSLKAIKAPIGLVASLDDEVLPHKEHAYQLIQHLVPFKLKVMRDRISHYAFLNPLSDKGKQFFKKQPPSYQTRVHQEVGAFAVSFFDEAFKTRAE